MNTKDFIYRTSGVCSKEIEISVKENTIKNIKFIGGCEGNASGISSLLAGMDIDDVIERLRGIGCSGRDTSCPDQLSIALKEFKGLKD
ncbi:MAG TPA: TIGR03905 family protein [Eubacteriaceae bacterium]|jgi:uncharacterized protein (TIGR03905 family)|nr:TIGR03905 family protein [Eubacteriaceae bacterium]